MGILAGRVDGTERALCGRLRDTLLAQGIDVTVSDQPPRESAAVFFEGLDVAIAVGGDGTVLSATSRTAKRGIPLLGVHNGKVGFLNEIEPQDIDEAARRLKQGDYTIEKRMMLRATLPDGRVIYALNDIVLEGVYRGRLSHYALSIDQEHVDALASDGVLVSTPTGSTSYALSCGGPIASPEINAMLLLPICAHSLRSRPFMLPDTSVIGIRSADAYKKRLFADGYCAATLSPEQGITVDRAPFDAQMIRLKPTNFYTLVHKKLIEWSQP